MTVVGAAGTDGDEGAAIAQSIPLPIAVDQDTALPKDAIQKKRRLGLHPPQTGVGSGRAPAWEDRLTFWFPR